jgi:hypothetical protein
MQLLLGMRQRVLNLLVWVNLIMLEVRFKKWKEFDDIVAKAVRGRTVIRFQPGLKPRIEKHLGGQHDQKTHGSVGWLQIR